MNFVSILIVALIFSMWNSGTQDAGRAEKVTAGLETVNRKA